jgi:hypothetical protein
MMQTSGGAEYCPPRSVAAACKSSLAVFEPGMVPNRKLKDRRGGRGSRGSGVEELISPQPWSCAWKHDAGHEVVCTEEASRMTSRAALPGVPGRRSLACLAGSAMVAATCNRPTELELECQGAASVNLN